MTSIALRPYQHEAVNAVHHAACAEFCRFWQLADGVLSVQQKRRFFAWRWQARGFCRFCQLCQSASNGARCARDRRTRDEGDHGRPEPAHGLAAPGVGAVEAVSACDSARVEFLGTGVAEREEACVRCERGVLDPRRAARHVRGAGAGTEWGRMQSRDTTRPDRLATEAEIISAIRDYLRLADAWKLKLLGGLGQRRGVLDILACVASRLVTIEVKRPGCRPKPPQQAELAAIQAAGGLALVATSLDEQVEALRPLVGDRVRLTEAPIGQRSEERQALWQYGGTRRLSARQVEQLAQRTVDLAFLWDKWAHPAPAGCETHQNPSKSQSNSLERFDVLAEVAA